MPPPNAHQTRSSSGFPRLAVDVTSATLSALPYPLRRFHPLPERLASSSTTRVTRRSSAPITRTFAASFPPLSLCRTTTCGVSCGRDIPSPCTRASPPAAASSALALCRRCRSLSFSRVRGPARVRRRRRCRSRSSSRHAAPHVRCRSPTLACASNRLSHTTHRFRTRLFGQLPLLICRPRRPHPPDPRSTGRHPPNPPSLPPPPGPFLPSRPGSIQESVRGPTAVDSVLGGVSGGGGGDFGGRSCSSRRMVD